MSMILSTKKSLQDFASKVHWTELGHPDDLGRFNDFIVAAYRNGDREMEADEFFDVVNAAENAPTDDPAQKKKRANFLILMFGKYEDGMMLLKRFEGD